MSNKKLSDALLEAAITALKATGGNKHKAAKLLGLPRSTYLDRLNEADTRGKEIPTFTPEFHQVECPNHVNLTCTDGIVLIGSDSHYWPGEPTTAHRAFVHFCKKLRPKIVIKNGDVMDGPSIKRHPSIGWEKNPTLIEEIEVCQERLGEIIKASKDAQHIWPLGNHDGLFETRLANHAPEYARVNGVHLKDHFQEWTPCWSALINDNVVVKHRFKGGLHATHNNALMSGKTMVTGHLHSLKITPFSDYNGTRFGVDCGTLAEPYSEQFRNYTEQNPLNWRSGFAVLTFRDGQLMWPEIVAVYGHRQVCFRGELIEV